MSALLRNINFSAGVDEAGRGSWAGPVVAAAVYLNNDYRIIGINDSKKLSAKKREHLYEEISRYYKVGIGIATAEEIDSLNILKATFLAMKRAISILNCDSDIYLIDGNINPNLGVTSKAIIRGDSIYESIAAASIIAKVTRDSMMKKISLEYPQYKWGQNAGYGTSEHMRALETYGITPYHRKSFKPIAQFLTFA